MSDLINFPTLIIQTINLAVVVFVLHRFLFKPYLRILDEEEAKAREIDTLHASSEDIKKNALADADLERKRAKEDAKKIREESKTLAKQEATDIVSVANATAESIRQKGLSEVENERRALEAEMQSKVLSVALTLNEKLFGKKETNREFIETISSK